MAQNFTLLTAAFALATLAGCGGGETDTGDAAGSASAQSASTHATCDLPNFQAEALALVNAQRASGASCGALGAFAAAPAVNWNDTLALAGVVQSDDMVNGNFFGHAGSTGLRGGQRMTAAGYTWSAWGENIAAGQPTVAAVVAAWMASDSHCANLMNPTFRDVGLVCVNGSASNTYRTYWTMTLGTAR